MKPPRSPIAMMRAQHAVLLERMARCAVLADELDAGQISPEVLLEEVAHLRQEFDAHHRYEERALRSLSQDVTIHDARLEEHVREHRVMRDNLTAAITDELRMTLVRLREHIALEEAQLGYA